MFELVKICQEKEFLCIHDDINDLIESALDSKLLLINSNSQRLDKKEQEVKNVVEQPAGQPEHLLSMGYEHLSITPETESNAENLLPIPSKCEVTLEDEIECDMPSKDECSPVFTTFLNPLFKDNDDLDSSDDESLLMKIELAHIKPEIPKSDFDFEEEIHLIENLLYDNSFPRPPEEINTEIADTIIESIPLLPIPVQDEEADLFLLSDNSMPPGIENVDDDPEGDIYFLEELLINDSILSHKSYDSNFEDNPSILRPSPKPSNVESFFDLKPDVIAEEISDKLNEDKCFDPGREINVSTKIEDDDYFPFMFVIRIFLPYFILPEISPLLLSAESEDTIFDPGISD
nr:hypothetical protein [Tanacetum cinerariifolium]